MPMPPDVESYLRSLAHRFNEPDLRKAAEEIERLRAEVAEWKIQDRIHRQNAFDWQLTIGELKGRIEELEEKSRKNVWDQWGGKRVIVVTTEQIDAAWESIAHKDIRGSWDYGALRTLWKLGIVACEECGGSKRVNDGDMDQPCPYCDGHGWKVVSDE